MNVKNEEKKSVCFLRPNLDIKEFRSQAARSSVQLNAWILPTL